MKIVSCLSPVRIRNRYTNEILYVPCRKCSACRNNRFVEYVNRLQVERQNWKHCLFITLTYAPEYVPHYDVVYDNKLGFVFTYGENAVSQNNGITFEQPFDENGNAIIAAFFNDLGNDVIYNEESRKVVYNAFNSDCQFRVVNKKHVQDFIKRLRKKLSKYYNNAKLRYFMVSEYGCDKTANYRPHYHGLLFFDSDQFRKDSYKILCEEWKYGFVGSSSAQTHASGYVAKYINSYSHYPKIYESFLAKPFCLFSKNPAIGVPAYGSVKAKEIIFDGINDFRIFANGKLTNVSFWSSLESRFFPKCREFSKISHLGRMQLYSLPKEYENVTKGFIDELSLFKSDFDIRDYKVAKCVNDLCNFYKVSLDWYVRRIEDYYATKELLNLSKFYEYQQIVSARSSESLAQLVNCYPEALNEFRKWYYDNVLPNVDFLRFGINGFDVDTYLFRKFDPYFKLSECTDWLDLDFSKFELVNSEEYINFIYDNLKRESDSNKNKRLNARKGVI